MKCRACGEKVILFSDGWTPRVLEVPKYGYTEYHQCEQAQGDNRLMLSKSTCKDFGLEYLTVEAKQYEKAK